MAGMKGQVHAKPRPGTVKNKAWQSMRILRRFDTADLCRTSDGKRNNVRKLLRQLKEHGYIEQLGGYVPGNAGLAKSYRLLKDTGPFYPIICDRCGHPLSKPCLGDDDE